MSRKSQRIQGRESACLIPNILNRKRKIGELSPEDQSSDENETRKRQSMCTTSNSNSPCSSSPYASGDAQSPLNFLHLASRLNIKNSQLTCMPSPPPQSRHPFPDFNWADPNDVWEKMLEREEKYPKDHLTLERHPTIQPRMRSILLDWLLEVSEAYNLHRSTFYLAVDMVDRYLASTSDIPKTHLQLIGVAAIFTAAKTEEIYPPKLSDFAFVTDGACTASEIITQERIILKALKWFITPVTAHSWLNTFMQASNYKKIEQSKENFVYPNYSGYNFIQIARLLDLCILDAGSLQFSNRVLTASAMFHMTSPSVFSSISGLKFEEAESCLSWMIPFAMTLRESGQIPLREFPQVAKDDSHDIQTHVVDLELLEKAQERQDQMHRGNLSPLTLYGLLTPPQSLEK